MQKKKRKENVALDFVVQIPSIVYRELEKLFELAFLMFIYLSWWEGFFLVDDICSFDLSFSFYFLFALDGSS